MPVISGQHGRRLILDLPTDASLRHGHWSYGATLETPNATATTTVTDHGDGLVAFLEDLAVSWRGWQGEKAFHSLEGELGLRATHDGLGTVTLGVRLCQPWPPTWSAEADLEIGAGSDLEANARQVTTWANRAP